MEVVLIVLGVLVLALIVWAVMRKQRERRFEGRREEAGELRHHARRRELEAERGEAVAEERAARARREAAAAEQQAANAQRVKAEAVEHEQRAAEVDPDAERERTRS